MGDVGVGGKDVVFARNFEDLACRYSFRRRLRSRARSVALLFLSLGKRWRPKRKDLQFLAYHHVLDDERGGFEAQLSTLKGVGQFLSLDDAVGLIRSRLPLDGRYFCITFDDGFRNCHTNAAPILSEMNVPAGFFVPTSYVGSGPHDRPSVFQQFFANFEAYPLPMEFLNRQELREMAAGGFVIGSHGSSHRNLTSLSDNEVEREMRESKAFLERELGRPCDHFACPFGIPGRDYREEREPPLAEKVGFRSFFSAVRGSAGPASNPYLLPRHVLLANEGPLLLRYFLEAGPAGANG
jgi:peptidoglycan/xylan/chitin deacetylase (PgdA/CDA1 family)